MDKWDELDTRLQGLLGGATVRAGGHEVSLSKRLDGEKLVIQVAVDGWIKGKWTSVDDDGKPEHSEGRFFRPLRSRVWPLKNYRDLKKALGKREADRMTALRTVAVSPYWNSPRSLIRHLKKHFPDLEVDTPKVEDVLG